MDETTAWARFIHNLKLIPAKHCIGYMESKRMGKWLSSKAVGAITLALLSGSAVAQLGLPRVGVPQNLPIDLPETAIVPVRALARTLEIARLDRLTDFVRSNRDAVEFDGNRNPSVRGVLVATGADDAAITKAAAAGFMLLGRERIDGLDIELARFAVPNDVGLKAAQKRLQKLLPDAEVDADNIYFQGSASPSPALSGAILASTKMTNASLGLIDGGVANHPSVAGRVEQQGFAKGAPAPSSHGTSVAALMIGKGNVSGGAPGGSLLAADVYGLDKAGGNASAIARSLGWLATRRASVVTISLIGPDNALLRTAIASAQRKGMIIVAAVGNDGPAAPAAFPASYPGVLAITGVDTKNRGLPEAGRALHIDFAAPGAGIMSAIDDSRAGKVRGTSFAAPLVAARLSLLYSRPANAAVGPAVRKLMTEAVDIGKKGRDPVFGHGLICGKCVVR